MKKHRLPVLPPMRCDDNCGECCGIVPVSEADYIAVQAYAHRHRIVPIAQGITCPFFQGGRCAVHPARPLLCRLFGHVEKMACPRGYNTNVDEAKVHAVVDQYPGQRHLHELLGPSVDIAELIEAEALR